MRRPKKKKNKNMKIIKFQSLLSKKKNSLLINKNKSKMTKINKEEQEDLEAKLIFNNKMAEIKFQRKKQISGLTQDLQIKENMKGKIKT